MKSKKRTFRYNAVYCKTNNKIYNLDQLNNMLDANLKKYRQHFYCPNYTLGCKTPLSIGISYVDRQRTICYIKTKNKQSHLGWCEYSFLKQKSKTKILFVKISHKKIQSTLESLWNKFNNCVRNDDKPLQFFTQHCQLNTTNNKKVKQTTKKSPVVISGLKRLYDDKALLEKIKTTNAFVWIKKCRIEYLKSYTKENGIKSPSNKQNNNHFHVLKITDLESDKWIEIKIGLYWYSRAKDSKVWNYTYLIKSGACYTGKLLFYGSNFSVHGSSKNKNIDCMLNLIGESFKFDKQ